jgi:bifunctional non-homologous end joining protein LigD
MPLTWAQVKRGLDPHAFTVRTAPKLLAKSLAWKEYGDKVPDLKTIARKLQ